LSGPQEGALPLIDEAAAIVSRSSRFTGLLWLTSLPARLSLVYFVARLVELHHEASHHAYELARLAWVALALWLFSLWGRQVFVRAARHSLQSTQPPPLSLLRGPVQEFFAYALAAVVLELLFWMLLVTFAAPILVIPVAGLAAAAAPKTPRGALRTLFESTGSLLLLFRLSFLFLIALLLVTVNLSFAAQAVLWASAGLLPVDLAAWGHTLSPGNPLYLLLLGAAGTLLVEPFWLAALTAHVERTRARGTGEDLRRWFEDLRART
jgi:hypothetical protein